MTSRALVIGGAGPSGPHVVEGLLARGYAVSVLSTGRHPIDYSRGVERILADPNFAESLETALSGRRFDVAIAQYGRLRHTAAALAGRCDRFVAISTRAYPGWLDASSMHRPGDEPLSASDPVYDDGAVPMPESVPLEAVGRFGARIVEADATVRRLHDQGAFAATILRYPRLYGARQAGAPEWSIVKRLLDGRTRILVPEGGFLVRSLLYAENAARIVLGVVDRPDRVAGQAVNCADDEPLTLRRWIAILAGALDREVELVSLPMAMAKPTWAYARFPLATGHQVLDTRRLDSLGIDLIPAEEALARTARWYAADPRRGDASAAHLADAFDYATEDRIAEVMDRARIEIDRVAGATRAYSHPLEHPTRP